MKLISQSFWKNKKENVIMLCNNGTASIMCIVQNIYALNAECNSAKSKTSECGTQTMLFPCSLTTSALEDGVHMHLGSGCTTT